MALEFCLCYAQDQSGRGVGMCLVVNVLLPPKCIQRLFMQTVSIGVEMVGRWMVFVCEWGEQ